MGKLKANSFKGYTTKPGLINNPGLGTDCNNVLINRGDLCSYPAFDFHKSLIDNGLMDAFFHTQFGNEDLIIWKDGEGMFQLEDPNDPIVPLERVNTLLNVEGYFDKTTIRTAASNWLQVGDWLYYLGLFRPILGSVSGKPRMIRLHKRTLGASGLFKSFNYIGVLPPRRARLAITSLTGILNEPTGLDFAFTFITNDSLETTETTTLNNDNAESAAVTLTVPITSAITNNAFTFRVYLPKGATILEPTGEAILGMRVGMYMKKSSEADYSFVKYSRSNLPVQTSPVDTYPGEPFVQVTLGASQGDFPNDDTPGTNMDDIVNSALIAVVSGRVVPPPSRHAIVFKKRVYYAPVAPSELDPLPQWALNHMQYSAQLIAGNGIEGNYIEDFINIGDESSGITGFVEYLGQLIIFKQKETWVLTDDILTGSIRKLFSGWGCVNRNGGHGYLVVGAMLFFVDASGVYSWAGEGNPQKISEAIKEDLDAIPRYVSNPLLDRYGYARLSYDPQYNLIYLTFPKVTPEQEVLPTFIFHLNEGGAWTKMKGDLIIAGEANTLHQLSKVILAESGNRYLLSERKFMRLGKLDHSPSPAFVWTKATWTGSILDGGVSARKKHWKFMNISSDSVQGLTTKLVNQNGGVTQTLVVGDGNNRVKIGRHLNELGVQFEPVNETAPFRIHNYELDIHLRGRR